MSTLPYLEIVQTLRVTACPTCGQTHAILEGVFLAARRDQAQIFCPVGHQWTPLPQDCDPDSNPDQRRLEALASLADTRLKLEAAQARLLALKADDHQGPITARELRRRAKIVAGRAGISPSTRMETPKRICLFCGGKHAEEYLAKHLRRQHSPELAAKPASYFDEAADRILSRFE